MEYLHIPVLLQEVISGLNVNPEGVYLDCTLGMGGHSEKIAEKLTTGRLIACDLDPAAIEKAKRRLAPFGNKVSFVRGDYKDIEARLDGMGVGKLDGILIDLGISSPQIDDPNRGFSYSKDAPLDMRMDPDSPLSAKEVLNGYSAERLEKIFRDYGEEKLASRIARKIAAERAKKPLETTSELAAIIESVYPPSYKYRFGSPSKRVFQAVRIEVNRELEGLEEFLKSISLRLKEGGRIAVISFHSLEDRIVKNVFAYLAGDGDDPRLPISSPTRRRELRIITKKPMTATEEELSLNKRAESAKLRIAERI